MLLLLMTDETIKVISSKEGVVVMTPLQSISFVGAALKCVALLNHPETYLTKTSLKCRS